MPTQAQTRKRAPKRTAVAAKPAPMPAAVALATELSKSYGSLSRFALAAGVNYTAVYRSLYPERFPRQKNAAYTLEQLRGLAAEHPAGTLVGIDLTDELRTALRRAFDGSYERYTDLSAKFPKLKFSWLSAFFMQAGPGRITPKVRALAAALNVPIPERALSTSPSEPLPA